MIQRATHDAVTVLTIDRQERRNAIDTAACESLEAALRDGGGGRGPGAGADRSGRALLRRRRPDRGGGRAFRVALRSLLDALITVPVPVMAAVSGAALGAGTQLAVACDLRVATADARFGIPAAKLGLMVDHWTVQRVALLAGFGPAQAMLLAAEVMDGTRAVATGLVHRAGGLDAALAWAASIASTWRR